MGARRRELIGLAAATVLPFGHSRVLRAETVGLRPGDYSSDAVTTRARLQEAIDHLSATGGGELVMPPEADIAINLPLVMRDHVTVDLNGSTLRNVRSDLRQISDTAALMFGSFGRRDSERFAWQPARTVAHGQSFVAPRDVSGFRPGELAWIVEAGPDWGQEGIVFPIYSQFAEVRRIENGELHLDNFIEAPISAGRGDIGRGISGCWVANVSWRLADVRKDKPRKRFIEPHVVNRAEIVNGVIENYKRYPWLMTTGMYKSRFEALRTKGGPFGIYGNGFVRSTLHNIQCEYFSRGLEMKYVSHDTVVTDFVLTKHDRSDQTFTEETNIAAIGERARNVRVQDGLIETGNHESAHVLVMAGSDRGCSFNNIEVAGRGRFINLMAFNSHARYSAIHGNHFDCGSARRAVSMDGEHNVVFGNHVACRLTHELVRRRPEENGGEVYDNDFPNPQQ